MRNLMFGALALSLTACGLNPVHEKEKKDESYSHEFDENGCKTGKHEFDAKADYCAALKNEGLNKGCAPLLRQKAFDADCN